MTSIDTLGGRCPRCGVVTEAAVLATGLNEQPKMGTTSREAFFCRCAGCKREFLVEQFNYVPPIVEYLEDIDVRNEGKEKRSKFWENRYPGEFHEGIDGLPPPVSDFYLEAVKALTAGLPNAAGAMFRKTLEAATFSPSLIDSIDPESVRSYERASLYERIESLKNAGAIPPALYAIADVLRKEGNAAVHDIETYTVSEAKALKSFADAFLHNTVTLQNLIEATRSAVKASKKQGS